MCKASVNFWIKQWAAARADGTLPMIEFCGEGETLEWEEKIINGKRVAIPNYEKSMATKNNFPNWLIKAVELQKIRLMESNPKLFIFRRSLKKQEKKYRNKSFVFPY